MKIEVKLTTKEEARGKGMAEQAAVQVFEKFRGSWQLFTNPSKKNIAGQKFWRKTVSNYTKGQYEETVGTTFDGYKMIFSFQNA
ncbi:Predicted acetyltransferase [Chlamydia abortus]|nr:Predicted acetyltransferase [Chlamydia abortus]